MAKKKKLLKSRKGAALAMVLFSFIFISIIAVVIFRVFMTNLHQAKYQEYQMEAYYLAHSGIELGYAALMNPDDINDEFSSMLYKDFANKRTDPNDPNKDIYEPKAKKKEEIGYSLDKGTLDVVIETKEIDGDWWVEIKSASKLEKQMTSKNEVKDSIVLRFPFENPSNKKWVKKTF